MKLAIIGSRGFNDYDKLERVLTSYFSFIVKKPPYINFIHKIISGGADGADKLGAKFANDNGVVLIEFKPDWDKYGKSAGFIRNKDIIDNCDFVLAFWDGKSKGTAHTLKLAKEQKKSTFIVYF